ncbi:ATP-binding cassette domain-containing protein [Oerskovia sp. M15]
MALSGPSGSGKTTTALVLLGLLAPDAGRVVVTPREGEPVDLAEIDPTTWWPQVAWVPQRPTLTPGRCATSCSTVARSPTTSSSGRAPLGARRRAGRPARGLGDTDRPGRRRPQRGPAPARGPHRGAAGRPVARAARGARRAHGAPRRARRARRARRRPGLARPGAHGRRGRAPHEPGRPRRPGRDGLLGRAAPPRRLLPPHLVRSRRMSDLDTTRADTGRDPCGAPCGSST